jgi:quercetin dioxygenase-like cupin family protein
MNAPDVKLGCVANVFVRMMHFKEVGDIERGHTHDFDHVTLVANGTIELTVNPDTDQAITVSFTAPQLIFIAKDKVHQLKALQPNTVACCIHGLRDENDDILDPSMVPEEVHKGVLAGLV